MYAALSKQGCEGGRWDPDAFFARGRAEVGEVLEYVTSMGVDVLRGDALDFGCAIGRLTQALAGHFNHVVGVDISDSMLEAARLYNQLGSRVEYVLNTGPALNFAADRSFDFVYTNKVLQHIPPEYQAGYIREFVRVLRPGGLAVFQTRNGPLIKPGTVRAWLYTTNRRYIRRGLQRLKGQPPYEMHFIARAWVEEVVATAGAELVDVFDLSHGRGGSLRYCVRKA